MATRQQIEQNKKKQAYLKANGVNVKIDGKWGRWQEQQYRRLTTRPRAYVPGILGTISKWYDEKFGDGTTYQIDPFDNGKITEDTRSDTRRQIDNQMRDPHSAIGFTVQNVAPAAAVAIPLAVGAEYLPAAGTFVKGAVSTAFNAARNPETIIPLVKETAKKAVPFVKDTVMPFLVDTAKGIVGVTAVNAASKATTGKTWGEQVAQSTGMPEGLGEFTNPGFVTGPFVYNTIRDIKYLFPRTKLYSDNTLVNVYATLARRYNLPDKARLPYLIRRVKNDTLDFTDDGNVILNGGRFRHTNFSYDRIVAPHSSGSWDKAQQTLLINPREFVKNNKFGSIEPSDMFTLQDPDEGLVVSPNDIINITANPTSTRLSTQHGIQTFSSTPLRQQELAALKADHQEYLDNFGKRFELTRNSRNGVNRDYWYAVFDIQKKFGRPKVKDVRLLEQTTGLKSGISSTKDIPRFRAIKQSDLNNVLVDEMEGYINSLPTFGNNRRFNWRKWSDYEGVKYPYKNFFYDPATRAEDNFTFPTQ